jgi:hypothetical protein
VRNGLLWDNYFILNGSCASLVGEHLTIDSAYALCNGYYAWAYLTNCLLTAVGYTNGFSGLSNAVLASASGVYQTVGGGRHYLAANSPYRNAGTTNINPGLAAELKRLTTYPPQVLTNCISVDTVLAPQAQRDTDTPDLGYHYAPLDFAVSGLQVTNATLVLTNGVAVATFGSVGLWLDSGAQLVSHGQPHLRNHLCHYAAVQEQAGGWGDGSPTEHRTVVIWSLGAAPQVTVAFTDFDGLAGRGRHLCSDDGQWALGGLRAWDCAFHVGAVQLGGTETAVLAFTNSLWERAPVQMSSVATLHSQNNLFWQSALSLWGWGSGTSQFHDNAFVGCSLSSFFVSEPNQSHNAYIGMADRLTPTNGTEVITNQLGFQVGPLGRFYQPADSVLLNAGSRLASEVGLYHYTTTTNQVKRDQLGGGHWAALRGGDLSPTSYWAGTDPVAFGVPPIDTDGDGWPDYFDDWPTDGTELCGDVVFIKGRLDDATAAVYCQVVNSQGTNSYWGLVERNGTFWVQQVQVARGTNWVTLTFTDAATNQAVTHLTWVRGEVDLVIDTAALTAADLSRSHCTVRGTISHPDYAVWVNGVPATVAPDGSWVAEQVPTGQGGTAVFLTRVYPPGEHPQGPPSPPVNPASPNAKDNGAEQDRPARVRVQSYLESLSYQQTWEGGGGVVQTLQMQWAHQQPAEAFEWLFQTGPQGDESWWETWDFWSMYWPPDEYALPQPGEPQKWGVCYCDYWYHDPPNPPITGSKTSPIGPPKTCATGDCCYSPTRGGPVLFWEQCHVHATRGQPPSQETWTRGACTRLILETGGKAHSKRPKRLSLFRLGWWNGPWHVTNAWYRDSYCPGETYEERLDPQRVWVGELGRLGPDGYLYVPLPDNAQYDVTPRVIPAPEPYFYRFGNIELCKLGLDLRAVTFHTVWAVLQDNGSGPYPTPHWTNDAHGQVVWSHPALYVSGDRVVTYTQFDVPGADPYANTFELVVRGQAVAGGLTKFNLWATNQPLSRHWTVTAVADAPLPADRVDFFNPLTIHWSYGVPGRAPFLPAGTSSNQVYVTLKPPITTNLFHTVVHLACANAVGQTDTEGTADAIYGGFAGRVVRRVHDNAQMTY